jgi:CheY-like chemotaxis protein
MTTTLDIHNYRYLTASSASDALMQITSHNPDVIFLDLGLPDMDGVDLIRKIRTWSVTPIIVISARSEDNDKIEALDAGADDYLTKPFSVDELLARLRVTQRRLSSQQGMPSHIFENGGLKVDFAAGTAYMNGEELTLTPIEYKLLCRHPESYQLYKGTTARQYNRFRMRNYFDPYWDQSSIPCKTHGVKLLPILSTMRWLKLFDDRAQSRQCDRHWLQARCNKRSSCDLRF